jgi:hypothetical protein
MDDFEIFLLDRNNKTIISLDSNIVMFNRSNLTPDENESFNNGDIDKVLKSQGLVEIDSMMIYRMYLGQVSRGVCNNCKKQLGTTAGGKGFGELP